MQKSQLFKRFFSYLFTKEREEGHSYPMTPEERKNLALQRLSEGELALLQENLSGLSMFEAASNLDPNNPLIWYRQGLAFVEYSMKEGREQSLSLANKCFKAAVTLDSTFFDAWVAWGDALLELGEFHEEHHYFLEAKEKYQKAISLIDQQPKELLAQLYWDYALVWMAIANHSGEAIDLRFALQAFQTSLEHQGMLSHEFLSDYGNAYLQLALLLNEASFYHQAIEYFRHSVLIQPLFLAGWTLMAEAFSQLYLNSADERFCAQGCEAYAKASHIAPQDADIYLSWGQLLTESGRLNKHLKQLQAAKEKGAQAFRLRPKDPHILAQWVEATALLGMFSSRLDLLIEAEERIMRASESFADDPVIWHAYGVALTALGRYYGDAEYYEMAIEKFQFGLSLDRSDAELWHQIALTHQYLAELEGDLDLLERATRFFTKAMDLKPACAGLMLDAANALFFLSEYEGYTSFLQEALSLYELILQQNQESILYHPDWLFQYARALSWLAELSEDESHYVKALDAFTHVLLIDPDFPGVSFRMGLVCAELGHTSEESGWYQRAVGYFRLAAKQDKENEQLWLEWGIVLVHLAQLSDPASDEARQYYIDAEQKMLLAGQLGNSTAYYHLAGFHSLLHHVEPAMQFLQKALEHRFLPPIDEIIEDEWLENIRATDAFAQFIAAIEAKQHQLREE